MEWKNFLENVGKVTSLTCMVSLFSYSQVSAEINWPSAPAGEIEGGKVGNYIKQIQDFILPDEFSQADGFQVDEDARLGIGVLNPDVNARLDIAGKVKIRGGNPALNRVLVSDDEGLAEWKDVASLLASCAAGQVLKSDGVQWSCAEDAVGGASGSVTSETIADNSITSSDILDGSIAVVDLAPNIAISQLSCVADQITQFDGSVWGCADLPALDNGAVNSDSIAVDSIQAEDIATGAVTADEILDGAIGAADIASGVITVSHLDASFDLDPKVGGLTVGKICEAQDVAGELKVVCSTDAPSVIEADTLSSVVTRGNTVDLNVGFGDFSGGKAPLANLHIRDDVNPSFILSSGTDDPNDVSLLGIGTATDAFGIAGVSVNDTVLASNAGYPIRLATATTVGGARDVRLSVMGNGNVGIGKEPGTGYKLDVAGVIRGISFQGDGSNLTGIVADSVGVGAVGVSALAADAVTSVSVADNAIGSSEIVDGSVSSVDIKLDDSASCTSVGDAGNIRFVTDNGSGRQDFQGCMDADGSGSYVWKSLTGIVSY